MLQTVGIVLLGVTSLGSGVMFLIKFAQAMFGKETNRWRNMLTSALFYSVFLFIYYALFN